MKTAVVTTWLVLCSCSIISKSRADEASHLIEPVRLPGIEGRIDHMALDVSGQRLFVAALGNNSVEVVDLISHKVVHSIRSLREPQGVAFLDDLMVIAVASGEDGTVRLFDAKSYRSTGVIDFQADADTLRYDPVKQRLYVGFGNG